MEQPLRNLTVGSSLIYIVGIYLSVCLFDMQIACHLFAVIDSRAFKVDFDCLNRTMKSSL